MKCDGISILIILSATLRPNLCFSFSNFGYILSALILEQFESIFNKKVRNIGKDICECLNQLASNFLIQAVLIPVHHFLFVHIVFWILRKIIRPNWNNYFSITNVPTTLHMIHMKRISGYNYFLHLFPNVTSQHVPVTPISLFECKLVCLVLRCIDIGKIYSPVTKNFKVDWSIYFTRKHTVARNQICLSKRKYLLVQPHQSWK